ncbi:MAG TPA: hypothetical protein VFH06_04915 [Candidatus Saccharimonadales bacterium]|nr:hypothetical protein [Candidatus Saccharimonadales bacterium]
MRSFENRLALGEVLDDVHRETVAKTLGGLGIRLTESATWDDIEAVLRKERPALLSDTYVSDIEYFNDNPYRFGGDTSIGELFGEEYVLTKSGRVPSFDTISDPGELGNDKYRRRIELFTETHDTCPDFTSIYFIPDTPPLAVHVRALIEIHAGYWERGETMPEAQIIEQVQKLYGSRGVEYISEEMAARIMHALRMDRKRLFNSKLFYNGIEEVTY